MKEYLPSVPVKPVRRLPLRSRLHTQPYWIALPIALEGHTAGRWVALGPRRTFLHDILCAQYYLYLSVRIRDDHLDGQAAGPMLAGVAEQLERCAEEILGAHFDRTSEFWRYLRAYTRETKEGIAEVAKRQRRVGGDPERMLDGFARTSSIFKVGSAAACVASGRAKLMGTIDMIMDHLAIGGQIIDDVRDMVEDLQRGRYNYAVQMLLKDYGRSESSAGVFKEVLSALLNPRNLEKVISVAVRHFKTADQLLKRLGLRELYDVPGIHQKAAEALLEYVHRRRIELLFKGSRTH